SAISSRICRTTTSTAEPDGDACNPPWPSRSMSMVANPPQADSLAICWTRLVRTAHRPVNWLDHRECAEVITTFQCRRGRRAGRGRGARTLTRSTGHGYLSYQKRVRKTSARWERTDDDLLHPRP